MNIGHMFASNHGFCSSSISENKQPTLSKLFINAYFIVRFLGLNTVTAYQRAKVYGLKIMNRGLNRNHNNSQDNKNEGCTEEWTPGGSTHCTVGTGLFVF